MVFSMSHGDGNTDIMAEFSEKQRLFRINRATTNGICKDNREEETEEGKVAVPRKANQDTFTERKESGSGEKTQVGRRETGQGKAVEFAAIDG